MTRTAISPRLAMRICVTREVAYRRHRLSLAGQCDSRSGRRNLDAPWKLDSCASILVSLGYIRKTPYFGGGIGALNAAEIPSASASRVCAGSRCRRPRAARWSSRAILRARTSRESAADRASSSALSVLPSRASCSRFTVPAPTPPARRPSPRCARSATSRAGEVRRRGRTCRNCRHQRAADDDGELRHD